MSEKTKREFDDGSGHETGRDGERGVPLPQGSAFVYYYSTQRGADLRLAFFGATFTYDRERSLEDSLMILFDRNGVVSAIGASRETQP